MDDLIRENKRRVKNRKKAQNASRARVSCFRHKMFCSLRFHIFSARLEGGVRHRVREVFYTSDTAIDCDPSVCFWVSVPVRGGPADRRDAVILGVSEPPLHRHALSSGELVASHTHTHINTNCSIKHLSCMQDS